MLRIFATVIISAVLGLFFAAATTTAYGMAQHNVSVAGAGWD